MKAYRLRLRFALDALPAVALLAASGPAAALERGPYSIEILVDGTPLDELAAHSRTYVEAREGSDFAVRLRNGTSRRVAVALSVDGLNVIDAKTTSAREASKWILDPYQTITLEGWQTGTSTARRFFFTTEDRSYGAWLGETRNLGLVSAAFFRERLPDPAPITRPTMEKSEGERSRGGAEKKDSAQAPMSADEPAATGIGEEIEHNVRRVHFEAERSPAAVMDIRYEYRDELARLGVLPLPYAYREDPLERRERARGFDEPGFAPDPYRR
jgi:hypothetical protein